MPWGRRFVPWPKGFLSRWEGKASELRKRLRLRDDQALDPFKLIDAMPGYFSVSAEQLADSHPEQVRTLREARDRWWAAAYREGGDAPWMILFNPWQTRTRLHASIMEELAHIHLGHKPSRIFVDERTGLPVRSFTKSREKEAYGVAAASLVPYVGLVWLREDGIPDEDIAEHFGVSIELLRYRSNITGAAKLAG